MDVRINGSVREWGSRRGKSKLMNGSPQKQSRMNEGIVECIVEYVGVWMYNSWSNERNVTIIII